MTSIEYTYHALIEVVVSYRRGKSGVNCSKEGLFKLAHEKNKSISQLLHAYVLKLGKEHTHRSVLLLIIQSVGILESALKESKPLTVPQILSIHVNLNTLYVTLLKLYEMPETHSISTPLESFEQPLFGLIVNKQSSDKKIDYVFIGKVIEILFNISSIRVETIPTEIQDLIDIYQKMMTSDATTFFTPVKIRKEWSMSEQQKLALDTLIQEQLRLNSGKEVSDHEPATDRPLAAVPSLSHSKSSQQFFRNPYFRKNSSDRAMYSSDPDMVLVDPVEEVSDEWTHITDPRDTEQPLQQPAEGLPPQVSPIDITCIESAVKKESTPKPVKALKPVKPDDEFCCVM